MYSKLKASNSNEANVGSILRTSIRSLLLFYTAVQTKQSGGLEDTLKIHDYKLLGCSKRYCF